MRSITLKALTFLLIMFCLNPKAEASYVLNVVQSGSDVVATGSGTVNTTALTNAGTNSLPGTVWPSFGPSVIVVGSTVFDPVNLFTAISGPAAFGSGPQVVASSGSGNKVGLLANAGIYLPNGYTSASALSSTSTWTGQTIAGLGLTPGTYTYTWGTGGTADSFILNIGAVPPLTPAPSSLYLLITGMLALAVWQFRRMRGASLRS